MKKSIRTVLSLFMMLVLAACNLLGSPDNAALGDTPALSLTVQTRDGATTFGAAGEVIDYDYVITNRGIEPLAGPAIVNDPPRQVICQEVNTVGNQDIYLDMNETISCTASYLTTDTDVSTGSVTNLATANVGGVNSNQAGVTLTLAAAAQPQAALLSALTLTKAAKSQTYSAVDQPIDFDYTITNIGTTPLGPAQFVIADNKFPTTLNCGPAETTLAPSQSVTCTFTYRITQADMAAASVTNSAKAAGAGQESAAASATVTNLSAAAATQTASAVLTATVAPAPSNLTPGSTIQHSVAVGEWLIQIGRCYGASFEDIRNANPQIADPDFILPAMIVTVPRIGSVGRIWGPPCVTFHIVQSGETWESIAQRYDADLVVLRKANPVTLAAGVQLKIPVHSAGTGNVPPPAATATFTPTATATATATTVVAQRINIPAGQTTASVAGVVTPNQTVSYVLAAAVGQVLSIQLTGLAGTDATLGVNGPTGLALKPPDGNFVWSTTITTAGDHFININGLPGGTSKTYTLMVTLTSATTPTVTATATSTPTTPPQ